MPDYARLRELANEASTQARYLVDAIGILAGGVVAINSTSVPFEEDQIDALLDGAKGIQDTLSDVIDQIKTEINLP